MKLKNIDISNQAFIYAAIHLLSNRMQIIGDKIDLTISSKQWFVLAAVSKFKDTPPNIGDIADGLGTSRQNIKKMANILEQRGFLHMEKDKSDSRNIRLYLTQRCNDYFESREQQEMEYLEGIFSGIDDEILATLREGLGKLVDNIDTMLGGLK
ncbi:MAG: MarR family transcriptional regulator [Defluviitaleaceae bacterium]|nr:MarR family transcriptional regulator [Defluviitaleaceae bacterium]